MKKSKIYTDIQVLLLLLSVLLAAQNQIKTILFLIGRGIISRFYYSTTGKKQFPSGQNRVKENYPDENKEHLKYMEKEEEKQNNLIDWKTCVYENDTFKIIDSPEEVPVGNIQIPAHISGPDREFLDRIIENIEANDEKLPVKELAGRMRVSSSLLYKKVKHLTGKSIVEFVRFIRLRQCALQLVHSGDHITDIAFQAGFSDVKYFRKLFLQQYGMTPSAFQKKYASLRELSLPVD